MSKKNDLEHTSTMLGSQNMKSSQRMVSVVEPYELPEGWKWCRLGDVAKIIMGQSPAGTSMTENQNDIAFIGGASDMGEELPNISRYTSEPTKLSKRDDVIVCIRATLGRPIFSDGIYCLGRGVAGIRSETLMKEYIKYGFLNFEQYLYDKATGSTFLQVSSKYLNEMPFPLPPTLAEQQRIVNRIESMFAKLDEAKEKAQNVVDGFETRKAAILHKAFTGELTAKWRKENGVSYDSWEEKTIGECCKSLKYGTAKKSESSGKVAVIRMGNLKRGEIVYDDLVFSNDEEDIVKYLLSKGDILFNRTNSPEWVGKTSIYRGDIPAIYAGYLIKLDYEKSLLVGDYLNYVLNSPNAKEYCNSVKTDGVNQSNINAQKIGAYVIPVPTLPEQVDIVRILDIIIEKENKAKQAAEAVLEQIDLLKKSILARAFRGEL